MAISNEIQRLQTAKSDIKTAIEGKGVTVPSSTLISGYATLIDEIEHGGGMEDGADGVLSVDYITIQTDATHTANIAYNPNCRIEDENGVVWDVKDWHDRWVANGYSAAGLSKPTGIWLKAYGKKFTIYWPLECGTYYDVSGTTAQTDNGVRLFHYNVENVNSGGTADQTVTPITSAMIGHGTAGKYKANTYRRTAVTGGVELRIDNTGQTFFFPANTTSAYGFVKWNTGDYMDSYIALCEALRSIFAICSGVPTTEPDGTTAVVQILNASGNVPAVGEDMYFWIGATNTGLLAKYNLGCLFSGGTWAAAGTFNACTQAIADSIYAKQKDAGINMNDTGVNSDTKPILTPNAKGATAVAVGGYWYIQTPYLSNAGTTYTNLNNNVPDAPAAYWMKKDGRQWPNEWLLLAYYLNRNTMITAAVNMLRNTEGLSTDVPAVISANCWSGVRYNASNGWYVYATNGVVNFSVSITRCRVVPCRSVALT